MKNPESRWTRSCVEPKMSSSAERVDEPDIEQPLWFDPGDRHYEKGAGAEMRFGAVSGELAETLSDKLGSIKALLCADDLRLDSAIDVAPARVGLKTCRRER